MSVKYSVLICVYNTEKYLSECIESVLAQSLENFELLIIDDGSTDSSGKICDEYAQRDKRVRVIHNENRGLVLSRKAALENACGDYVLFSDSDDYICTDLLESIDSVFDKYNCDMVCYDMFYVYANAEPKADYLMDSDRYFSTADKSDLYKLLLSTKFNSLCRKCFRKDKFQLDVDYDYFKGFNRGEDRLLTSHILHQLNTVYYLHKPLYNYRQLSNGMTSKYSLYDLERASRSTEEIKEMIESDGLFDMEAERMFYSFCRYIFSSFLVSLSHSEVGQVEKIETLKACESIPLYKWAIDKRSDSDFSKAAVLKFALLRKKMYSTLMNIMKAKNNL
jgi:glycosyltransferase involved in cell wall biosynthesis